jgi:hypothetical protein
MPEEEEGVQGLSLALGENETLSKKMTKLKKVAHLPTKRKALSSKARYCPSPNES